MATSVAVPIVKLLFMAKMVAKLSALIIRRRMKRSLQLRQFRPRVNQFAWAVLIAYEFSTGARERVLGKSLGPSLGCPLRQKVNFLIIVELLSVALI